MSKVAKQVPAASTMLEPSTVAAHQLERLSLAEPKQKDLAIKHVQQVFGELLAVSPSTLIRPAGGGDTEQEAKMWDCFAEVYEKEVQQLQQGSQKELPTDKKRQILADILVWAEITQAHYDSNTASFVTEPHGGDASFQRIGKLFKRAKQERGLA